MKRKDYGARFYDPSIARFTTIDPLAEDYSFQNPYAYAANNPIKFIDFMGLGATYNWDEHNKGNTGVYNDEQGNSVGWSDVQSEYGLDSPSNGGGSDPPNNGIGLTSSNVIRTMQLSSIATRYLWSKTY